MRRASAAIVLTCLIVASPLSAQNAKQMQPTVPSPTAASLGKFGDVAVSYYTGLPQISIPLFSAKGKTLELPISLDYHASGIKVEEIGGWVGMGWALEAGGVITRTVRGIPDERFEGYWRTGNVFYDPQNQTFPAPVSLVANIYNEVQDGEPDQFFFNFAGQSGEFIGGDTSTTHTTSSNIFVTIPHRKWRIQPVLGADPFFGFGTILSWIVTTEDGTKYTFAAAEITLDRNHQWQSTNGRYSYAYASSWYLTEIRSPGGDVITLTYADYTAEHHLGMFREEVNDTYESEQGACGLSGYQVGGSTIRDLHSQSYHHAKQLASITSAAHSITFHTSLRDDARSPYLDDPGAWGPSITGRVQQEPKLDSITIKTPEGVFQKRFEFEYTYGGPLNGRLTLLNLYEKDGAGNRLPPYSFTYDGPALPVRYTDRTDYHPAAQGAAPVASFALDAWGYYNGAPNASPIPSGTASFSGNSYVGADRTPNVGFMKAGSLIKITYPTGGFNEFVYEANDYSSGANLVQDAPVHQNASVNSSPGDVSARQTDFTVAGIDPTVSATVDVYMSAENCSPAPCLAELWQGTNRLSAWTGNRSAVPWTLSRGVTYTIKAWNNGSSTIRVAVSVHWDERIALTKKIAGGLRIKEVHADDGMGTVTIRKYSYQYDDGRSTGWITLGPRFDYNRNMISGDGLRQCIYYSRSSTPQNALGNGLQVTYAQVTESLGVNGVFGVVRRRFDANCDCANAVFAANQNKDWPFLRYTTDAWRRGQLLSTEELSSSGALQRATSNTWSNPPIPHPTITFRGLAVDVYSMISRWYGPWPITTTYFIWSSQFQVQTALKVQTAQATTFYDTTGTSSITTSQQFKYGNPSHAQLTEITETNSDGTQRITRMKYPGDYATGGAEGTEAGALDSMQNVSPTGAHMPGVVIERSVSARVAGTEQIVQAEITTFKKLLAGQFLPYKHYVLNSPSPVQ